MPLNGFDLLLWVIGLLGHMALLLVLLMRQRARVFPAFTALIAGSVIRTVLLAWIRRAGSDQAYFVAYSATEIVDLILQFAVVYEVASHVFRPLGRWAPDVRQGIRLLVAVSLVVAAGLNWMGAAVQGTWRTTLLVRLSFFSSTLMSELFLGMVVLSVTAGLPWRTHVARIAHGLGMFSLVDVAIEAAHTLRGAAYHTQINTALTYLRMTVYLLCVVYWIVTLWRKAPPARRLSAQAEKYLRDLQTRLAYDLYTLRSWKKQ